MAKSDKKLLIVEDEPFLLDVYKFAFECSGYNVLTAKSKAEAIQIIEDQTPDMVLLDIIIPEMENGLIDYNTKEGYFLLKEIREKFPQKNIPVVVFTNLDEDIKTQQDFHELNIIDFIIKSNYSPKQLVQHVSKIV